MFEFYCSKLGTAKLPLGSQSHSTALEKLKDVLLCHRLDDASCDVYSPNVPQMIKRSNMGFGFSHMQDDASLLQYVQAQFELMGSHYYWCWNL